MFSSSKSITSPHDFKINFVELLNKINSNVCISTIDRRINAKSALEIFNQE